MEIEGIVRNGVIVPEGPSPLPEGTRVRIEISPGSPEQSFGDRLGKYRGAVPGLPEDLATQHEHYRLGTPKR